MLINILCVVVGAVAGILIGINNPTQAAALKKYLKDTAAKVQGKTS